MSDLRKLLDECTEGPWDYHIGHSDWGMPRCNFITRAGDDPEPITGQVIAQVDAITPYCLGASAKDRKLSANANANARLIALAPDLAAALLKAEEALSESANELDAYYAYNYSGDYPYSVKKLEQAKASNPARVTLTEIRKLTGAA